MPLKRDLLIRWARIGDNESDNNLSKNTGMEWMVQDLFFNEYIIFRTSVLETGEKKTELT